MSPKPKYRLQALLTLKDRLKKKAEMALARAIRELNEAKERLKKLEKEKEKIIADYENARSEMAHKMLGASSVGEGNVYMNFLRKLKEDEEEKQEEIDDQQQVVHDKEDGVAMARRDYIDAAKELQVMEKHKELWIKKQRKELSMREQREMNELGNSIHQLRRWRGERSAVESS